LANLADIVIFACLKANRKSVLVLLAPGSPQVAIWSEKNKFII